MKLKLSLSFLAALAFASHAFAEGEKPYWRWYVDDTVEFARSVPEQSFVQKAVIMGLAGVAVFQFDRDIAREVGRNDSKFADGAADVGEAFGDGLYVVSGIAAGYAYGALAEDRRAVFAAKLALESYVLSGLAANGIKRLAHRHRPKEGDGPNSWDGASFESAPVSFPSGHTTTAFSWAAVLADVYADKPWVSPVAYTAASLAGFARIYEGEHWGSDVAVGALLGYFTSKALLAMHRDEWSVTAMPAPGGANLMVSVKF